MRVLIVGAGLAGLSAGVLLKRKGHDVTVLERRNFVGGNCNDHAYSGVYVHEYGPHIFHTNHEDVWHFLSEFTTFTNYRHKVVALTPLGDELLPVPYNKVTEALIGEALTDDQIRNNFFFHYSQKMWGCKFNEIPEAITGRVKLRRDDWNTDYFLDTYQGMPAAGYFSMFARMVAEIGKPNIKLSAKRADWAEAWEVYDHVIFTGRLDEFWDSRFGDLPYRALQFECRHSMPVARHAVVNQCINNPATRVTDFSLLYPGNPVSHTVICREFPQPWTSASQWEPSYPMRGFKHADDLLAKYEALVLPHNVTMAGRLGTYRYMNMDAVVKDVIDRVIPTVTQA